MKGYVTLYLGSMRSSKTSKLFDVIDQANYRKLRHCLVRPTIDTRDFISRYKDIDTDIILCDKLTDEGLPTKLKKYDIICIDEGQFIEHLFYVHNLALLGKEVYIAALNGDTEMRPWDNISNILPLVDYIERLSGVCEECGSNKSTFSYYTEIKTEQIIVGDGKYMALCRDCYNTFYREKMGIIAKDKYI